MRATDFIKDKPSGVLTIFDIDDTLFHTTAKIKVVKDGKVVRTLTNQQFNDYDLEDGEEYDFGEFRNAEKFRQESEPIGPMLDELKTILDHTRGRVIMLTARSDFDDKDTFLQTFKDHGIDMSKIHVHRAGNLPGNEAPAHKKAVWVRKYLNTGDYNRVSLYDDSMTNLRVFKELEDEYPDVEFDAYHITGKGDVSALEERKRRKQRKSKRIYGAAWGPGPYGLYGYDAGYSGAGGVGDGGGGGESRINEAWTPDKKQRIKDFALWAIKLLEIEQAPRIKLVGDSGTSALGYFDLDTQNIVVTVKDRHQMDIMRTLAHELVHRKQNEIRELDGATGSPDENEANSLAGVLLRWWGKKNPEQFNEHILKKYILAEQDVAEGRYENDPNHVYEILKYALADAEKTGKKVVWSAGGYYKLAPLDDPRPALDHNYDRKNQIAKLQGEIDKLEQIRLIGYRNREEYKKLYYRKYGPHYKGPEKLQAKLRKQIDNIPYAVEKEQSVDENFADGRNPQDKGDSKRHGISKGMSIADLKKVRSSDSASPRKKQLAHWQINMRQGKKK